jgi:hypothetical protein
VNHKEICLVAARWLRRNCLERCPVVFSDLVTVAIETPDVIGFNHQHTVLIEVKTSRRDFLADKKKIFRQHPEQGMGSFRLYLCPEGVINPTDVPEKWGLLWIDQKGKIRTIKQIFEGNTNSQNINRFLEKHDHHERAILYSALRRLEQKQPNTVPQI